MPSALDSLRTARQSPQPPAQPPPVAATTEKPFPPAGPCQNRTAPLDLFAAPEDQPPPCGCLFFWLDPYGTLHCCQCQPPPAAAMVRQKLTVALTAAGGFEWIDHGTRQPVAAESGPASENASSRRTPPPIVHLLGDDADGWIVLSHAEARCGVPADKTIDEWWESIKPLQSGAWEAWRHAREYERTGYRPGASTELPETNPKSRNKKTAAKKCDGRQLPKK